MNFRIGILFLSGIMLIHQAFAQNDTTKRSHALTLNGYIKYLELVSFTNEPTELLTNSEIHNRLNFRYQPNEHLNFRLEVRNRLYYGEIVQNDSNFATTVTGSYAPINLSKNWIDQNAVLFNTTIDRASAEYIQGKWDITLGRQRINWGINTVWTPNDIFNAFNYFDFDYEERPGTDALRAVYEINSSSSIELAVSPGKTFNQSTEAVMFHYNKWDYDFQVFSGIYQKDFTIGAGWAGNIFGAGFKGEFTYFTPYASYSDTVAFASSMSLDYGFKNGIYVLVSGLYNKLGQDTVVNLSQLASEYLSPKDLFPFKYTIFSEISYPFTPIFKASLATMFSPTGNSIFVLPTLTYSIANDWVLDFIGQSFFSEQGGRYRSVTNNFYLRIKWGF
jgi:hypothetical protein